MTCQSDFWHCVRYRGWRKNQAFFPLSSSSSSVVLFPFAFSLGKNLGFFSGLSSIFGFCELRARPLGFYGSGRPLMELPRSLFCTKSSEKLSWLSFPQADRAVVGCLLTLAGKFCNVRYFRQPLLTCLTNVFSFDCCGRAYTYISVPTQWSFFLHLRFHYV